MNRVWPVVVLVVGGACSSGETAASSTSSAASTTIPTTSTTTTTQARMTTTTVPTTTTEGSTTTSRPFLLPGVWAEQPLIVSAFGALGWWDGSSWTQVDDSTDLPVAGGEDYQVARLGGEASTTGGAATLLCDPIEVPGVELAHPDLLGEWPGPYGVAISAPWQLTPHLVEELADDGTYAGFAAELLAARGLGVANPQIKQLIRADLEGDGINEVIVVAEDIQGSYHPPTAGDYSIAFLRKVVDGEVQTAVLGESVITDADVDAKINYAFAIGAVADLSGDGTMEVVVSSAYYEGLAVEVWEYFNDDLGMIPAVRTGCGV